MISPLSPTRRPENKRLWSRPKISDGPTGTGHKVSFSGSSKGSKSSHEHGPSDNSASSRSSSPNVSPQTPKLWQDNQTWQKINRKNEALWQEDIPSPEIQQPRPFHIYHDSFLPLLGPSPTLQLLISDSRAPYFHEAGVYHPATSTLFVTSNQIPDPSPDAATTSHKTIVITKIEFFSPTDFTRDKVRCPERNYMVNGGANYKDGLVLCAQGSLNEPAGLIYMEAKRPHKTTTLINNYHSRPFNSPNDVVVHSDGAIWFTDPIYGYEQGFRPKPRLPQHIYRFNPTTGDIRAMADGFGRPNGLCFSPDEQTLYITDTDSIHCSSSPQNPSSPSSPNISQTRASTIYAYSVLHDPVTQSPFLTNRRLFAYADTGAPDGIKCDVHGNVYAGCGDGVNVWNSGGVLIGKVLIEGGCANFCFGRRGEIFCFGETKLWRVQMGDGTRGAVLGI